MIVIHIIYVGEHVRTGRPKGAVYVGAITFPGPNEIKRFGRETERVSDCGCGWVGVVRGTHLLINHGLITVSTDLWPFPSSCSYHTFAFPSPPPLPPPIVTPIRRLLMTHPRFPIGRDLLQVGINISPPVWCVGKLFCPSRNSWLPRF